jgi:hypothetical protein
MRVATTAGIALGLTVAGAGVAGAATKGTGSKHSNHTGKYASTGLGHPAVFGTVATVGTDSFTVTTRSGSTVTVDVTNATTYRDRGVTSPSFASVKVGETVAASGTETSGTVAATSVDIGTLGGRPDGRPGGGDGRAGTRPAVFGTVATVGTNSFTVTTRSGSTVTVDVSDATTYRDQDATSPSVANVKVGEMVAVSGTETSGTVAATSVGIGSFGGRWGGR